MAAPDFLTAASLTPGVIVGINLPTVEAPAYTVGAGHGVKLGTGSICNTTGAAVTVTISVVPSGGTAGATNRIISAFPLGAGDTQSLKDYLAGAYLGPGDFISAVASATGVALVLTAAVAA